MREVTVLSPHRDDAVFSLATTLRKWCNAGVHVRVVNFFTYSAHAPRAIGDDRSATRLSTLRRLEDRLALRALHPAIEVHDWSLVDAPLRLHRATADVMGPKAPTVQAEDLVMVSMLLHPGCTIAPLGLGDHVDHRTVREAAMKAIPSHWLAFYEDVPYARWTPDQDIRQRAAAVAATLQRRYRRVATRSVDSRSKRRIAALYRTQIAPEEAVRIATGPEKIWVPAHSQQWPLSHEAVSVRI